MSTKQTFDFIFILAFAVIRQDTYRRGRPPIGIFFCSVYYLDIVKCREYCTLDKLAPIKHLYTKSPR